LILAGIVAISLTFKPFALDRMPSKTALVVFELSDRSVWQDNSEAGSRNNKVVFQKAN